MLGKRCPFCGLYVKRWKRLAHERWHADQVVYCLKLLCPHCASEHGKFHAACGRGPACRCSCNAWEALEDQ